MKHLIAARLKRLPIPLLMALLFTGCYVGYWTYNSAGGGTDTATGEEETIKYPANEAFNLTEDVLRGEGVLFEAHPPATITTFWKNADNQPGFFESLIGIRPRYRYEIQVVPENPNQTKIVINVRAEDVPEDQIDRYKASKRLDLFGKIKELAANLPPEQTTPNRGGVNFVLLPNETLQGLAKRVTGSTANWKEIAKDNGIGSPSEVAPYQTLWVRNSLLKNPPAEGSENKNSDADNP